MDTNYMKEFLMLAQLKNYTDAAEEAFISQPTLSRHIKAIEDEVGMELFVRGPRRVELTEAGEIFQQYVSEFVRLQNHYIALLNNPGTDAGFSLTIGSVPVMAPYGITDIISNCTAAGFDINLRELGGKELKKALKEGECDVIFIREPSENSDSASDEFVRVKITVDYIIAVVAEDHPLACRDIIHLSELKNEKLLLPVKDSSLYMVCVELCKRAGFEPRVSFTSRGTTTGIDLASKHAGIALLMKEPALYESQGKHVKLLDIEESAKYYVNLAYNPNVEMRSSTRKFLQIVEQMGFR